MSRGWRAPPACTSGRTISGRLTPGAWSAPIAIVGFSTHTEGQLDAGCAEPVDYLAIGPVFATGTKTDHAAPVGLDGVARAAARAARAGLPLVAIGGITLETAPAVIEAGAAAVAVIADLIAGDPAGRSPRLSQGARLTKRI